MLSHIKLVQETLTFGDIEIEKNKFYRNKTPTDKDIEKMLVYNNIFFGEKKNCKYSIDYLYNDDKLSYYI